MNESEVRTSSPLGRTELSRQPSALPEDDEPDLRNNLLASLCKTGRDFSWLLLDRLEAVTEEEAGCAGFPPTLTRLSSVFTTVAALWYSGGTFVRSFVKNSCPSLSTHR